MPCRQDTRESREPGPWLTVPEGARYARCRLDTFRRLCAAEYIHVRHLPVHLVGVTSRTTGLVDAREIDALLRSDDSEHDAARAAVARMRANGETA